MEVLHFSNKDTDVLTSYQETNMLFEEKIRNYIDFRSVSNKIWKFIDISYQEN